MKKFGAERAPLMQKMMTERGKESGINLQVLCFSNERLPVLMSYVSSSFGGKISQTTE